MNGAQAIDGQGFGWGFRVSMGMRTGFTLVELLVVIAIIALLVSILLPSLAGGRTAARSVVCQSNNRQLGIAVQSYVNDDKKERFPAIRRHSLPPSNPELPGNLLYQVGAVGMLQPHLGGESDPDFGADFAAQSAHDNTTPVRQQQAFDCPAAVGLASTRNPSNIQYLVQGGGRVFVTPPSSMMGDPIVRWSEYWFNDSARVVGANGRVASGVSGMPVRQIRNYNWVVVATDALDEFPRHIAKRAGAEQQGTTLGARASGANNFLWGDGHVSTLTFREYYLSPDRFGAPAPFYNFGHVAP